MKFFRTVKIKLLIPPFILFIFIGIMALVFGKNFFYKAINERMLNSLNIVSVRLQHQINENFEEIEGVAHLFSSMKTVSNNFSAYILNKDSVKNENLFSNELSSISSDFDYNIDFFTTDGQLIYSNHKQKRVSDNKIKILKKVANTQKKFKGFENIFGQKCFLVIYPVISSKKTVGLVAISQNITNIAESFFLPENTGLVIVDENKKIIYETTKIENKYRDKFTNIKDYYDVGNYKIVSNKLFLNNKEKFSTVLVYLDTTSDIAFVRTLLFLIFIFLLSAFLIGGLIYTWGVNRTIIKPLKIINNKIRILSKGEITEKINKKPNDEFGQIIDSVNVLIENQKSTTVFAKNIGLGELDVSYKALGENDQIGNALNEMKEKLKQAKVDENKRKLEDEKRNWATNGFAKFSDILRQSSDDIEEFSDSIISNLVKYTDSNQGGIFIYNEEDKENITLDLVSMYAYNRKKYTDISIKLGEGLIGTSAIEKQTIYLTDIPDDYITITSGLGEATPRSILIVPLKLEDKVFGVIELASFNEFETYMIDFIEKLGESIAQSINTTKTNIRTNELLEQSQQQQEEMKAQEEELRQNMEEMLATQEDMKQASVEAEKAVNNITNLAIPVLTVDKDFSITYINPVAAGVTGLSVKDCLGKKCYDLLKTEQCNTDKCCLGKAMKDGNKHTDENIAKPIDTEIPIEYTGIPIYEDGEIVGALEYFQDLTEKKAKDKELDQLIEEMSAQEEELRQKMETMLATQEEYGRKETENNGVLEAINASALVAMFDTDWNIISVNNNFEKLFGIPKEKMLGMNHQDFSNTLSDKKINLKNRLKKGEIVSLTTKLNITSGKKIWLKEVYAPVKNTKGNIIKIVNISTDISKEKEFEQKLLN